MRKLLTAFATAAIVIAGSSMIWKAEATTMTEVGGLAPLTKSYTSVEKVYWRRHYRRGYYGYGHPYYGYGYRPYGYGYGWRPGFSISIGPRWGWGY